MCIGNPVEGLVYSADTHSSRSHDTQLYCTQFRSDKKRKEVGRKCYRTKKTFPFLSLFSMQCGYFSIITGRAQKWKLRGWVKWHIINNYIAFIILLLPINLHPLTLLFSSIGAKHFHHHVVLKESAVEDDGDPAEGSICGATAARLIIMLLFGIEVARTPKVTCWTPGAAKANGAGAADLIMAGVPVVLDELTKVGSIRRVRL